MIRFWVTQVKSWGHHMTKYGQKFRFRAVTPFKCKIPWLFHKYCIFHGQNKFPRHFHELEEISLFHNSWTPCINSSKLHFCQYLVMWWPWPLDLKFSEMLDSVPVNLLGLQNLKFEGQRSRSTYEWIFAKLEDQKQWSENNQIWFWIQFWESWLNLMHTTKKVSEGQCVTWAYWVNLQAEASHWCFSLFCVVFSNF